MYCILPIDYPKNMGELHHYKPEYGTKPIVNFTQPVYHESVCFIVLRDSQKTKNCIKNIKYCFSPIDWDIIVEPVAEQPKGSVIVTA